MAIPAYHFGQSLNIAIYHLLFGGSLPTRLINDNEPVVVITSGKKRSHFGGGTVAKVGPRAQGRVGVPRAVDAASDRNKTGVCIGDMYRERSGGAEEGGSEGSTGE